MTDPDPPTVDYQSPPPGFSKPQFWAGLTVSLFICGLCFVALFFTGVSYYEDDSDRPKHWAWLALLTSAAAIAGVTWLGIRRQRRSRGRGFLAGVILGLGLGALPVGTCFYVVSATAVGG